MRLTRIFCESRRMDNAYRWSPATPATWDPAATWVGRVAPDDVASMAHMWVAATYDDLRRAGPGRGTRVRGVLDRYVIPWFGPQTASVGDITYFMVHEWLLIQVGRGRSEPDDRPPTPQVVGATTVGLLVKRGELEVDPETDSSNAVFVTRESVEAFRVAHITGSSKSRFDQATVPLADVVRFTGRSRTELLDLVRAGVLEQATGRGACELAASSLRHWMAASA